MSAKHKFGTWEQPFCFLIYVNDLVMSVCFMKQLFITPLTVLTANQAAIQTIPELRTEGEMRAEINVFFETTLDVRLHVVAYGKFHY